MSFTLQPEEWALLQHLPTQDLVDLAADLDVLIPADVDKRTLLELCVPRLVERGRRSGLPFSKYDREDLEALGAAERAALGRIQGVEPDVDAILRAGERVYRTIERERKGIDPVAMMLPSLLRPVLRHAVEQGQDGQGA
ncbi:MAG: hypothetical protein KC656_28340 [Myxococcales bacterium]|nr:hypothetical protein [Myxococcales bacterium]MCB9662698.1 hypothetical protein [Alphaproteobacteria bacterium]